MGRRFLVVIIFLLLAGNSVMPQAGNQYKRDSIRIWKCPTNTIELNNSVTTNSGQTLTSMPFLYFLCKDVRFETNYIGVMNRKRFLSGKGFCKLKFIDSAENVLSHFLNDAAKYASKTNTYQLLCFIKQLRLTQTDSVVDQRKSNQLCTTASVEIEAYLVSDDRYYPAVRLDTTASTFSAEEKDFSILVNMLNAFAEKAVHIDSSKILKRKAYAYNEVINRYAQRFNHRIITDTVLNKGVYLSKEEFLHNSPSVMDYEFNKKGILYTRIENNVMAPTREAYGMCDGSRIWMNVNKVFRPLIRQGRTFEFLGDMKLLNERTNHKTEKIHIYRSPGTGTGEYAAIAATAIALTLLLDTDNTGVKFIYQLNLETGGFY